MNAYDRERAFYIKNSYLTTIIIPLMIERGDGDALYLIKEELPEWKQGVDYANGNTVVRNGLPITCTVPHNTAKHLDWTPETRPEYWHKWERRKKT